MGRERTQIQVSGLHIQCANPATAASTHPTMSCGGSRSSAEVGLIPTGRPRPVSPISLSYRGLSQGQPGQLSASLGPWKESEEKRGGPD